MSRIMIAGTGSGSGKTTIVCGLCRCIKDLGRTPTALKCGPDYIDAMFHSHLYNPDRILRRSGLYRCDVSFACVKNAYRQFRQLVL